MDYISTKPDSTGKENALQRASQLTVFKWTPLCDVPTLINKKTGKINTVLPAGVEMVGIPYSRNEANDKFICENVSIETLVSAIANPESVLYRKNMYGCRNASNYYGIVCSAFVRYALGITPRYSVKHFDLIPGMRKIADCNRYSVDEIELCDVLHAFGNGRNHVALITDILRDQNNDIVEIEVSEAVLPACKRARYSVETFYQQYSLFALWRYDYIDSVPACDTALCSTNTHHKLPDIAIDFGNKANYFLGQETVISVFRDIENNIQIYKNGDLYREITIHGKGNVSGIFDVGHYQVKLSDSNESVEFFVNFPLISHRVQDGKIFVTADPGNPASTISHMEFREKATHNDTHVIDRLESICSSASEAVPYHYNLVSSLSEVRLLTDEEINTHVIVAEIPEDAGYFKVTFRNQYGLWTHQMIKI